MAKLNQLFGLQKFAENAELNSIISETHSRYGTGFEISDEDLELATAGVKIIDPGKDSKREINIVGDIR